jgi:hypothetical protein
MKRILIWGAGAALCMIALPLLLLSLTVGYDAVAVLLLLLLAVNPLFFILLGVQVGFDPPKTWWMPCAAALLFPLCYWMALREVVWNLYLYAVLYLVLTILFNPTEPFFLFFNREKDLGMPPRKAPVVEEATENWGAEDYEYL